MLTLSVTRRPVSEQPASERRRRLTASAQSVFLSPFYQSPAVKVNQPGPPSRLITVLSCHIIQAARSRGGSVSRGRCAELWDGQAFCGLSDSIRQTTCLFCLAVDIAGDVYPWQRHISADHRQTDKWKRTPTDREPAADLLISLRYLELDVFSLTADKLKCRQALNFALRLHFIAMKRELMWRLEDKWNRNINLRNLDLL